MKAIIFGAGFIGTATGNRIHEDGGEVVGADNWMIKSGERQLFDCQTVDVRKPKNVEAFISAYRPPVIFWFPARQGYKMDHAAFADVQVRGTYSLFQALDALKEDGYRPDRIVLASSQAIYSPGVDAPEGHPKDPPSVYGFSKLQQEEAFRWFCRSREIVCLAMRYSIVLGPGQALQSTESGLLRNWNRCLKDRKAPEIYGDGEQLRDFVHIDDVARANIQAAKYPVSESFNIGGQTRSVKEMAAAFDSMTDCKTPVVTGKAERPGGEYSMTSSSSYAKERLKWEAIADPEACMRDFLDYAK